MVEVIDSEHILDIMSLRLQLYWYNGQYYPTHTHTHMRISGNGQ